MRTGISIILNSADRRRLAALARDRNAPHKHVWRAEIVLLSDDGVGANEIIRQTNHHPKPFTWIAEPDRQNHGRCQARAPSVRFHPLASNWN